MHSTADDLSTCLDELLALSDETATRRITSLAQRLDAGDLRVALVGEAKRGKSTFGNALLGRDVLPTGVIPVTAISTEVAQGSPERADVTFENGEVRSVEVGALDQFVSERRNPHNRLRVSAVHVYVPDVLLHPRLRLIDTPGAGSVHQHNTEAAQDAFTAMDAAVFVLTADPPISASELKLLNEVAGLAVRVFVVLNKADQLEPRELDEAVGFVSEVVGEALGSRARLWVCTAREGLRARLAADEHGWRASGMADFAESLSNYLVEHREGDLRASIAASATRVARQQLDSCAVTLAAVEADDADGNQRLDEFSARLDAVDQRRVEALDFVAAHVRRERRRLAEDARQELARTGAAVQQRLEAALQSGEDLSPGDLEKAGREVIAAATRPAVETWRAGWHGGCRDGFARLVERLQQLLEEASGDLVSAARDLLGIRLTSNVPALVAPGLSDLAYDFAPEVGWDQALVSGARTRAPAGIARRRVAKYLRAEAERIVDKHFGRARADFQDLLEEAGRGISPQVDETFRDLTEGLRRGQRSAVELRSYDASQHRVEREWLVARHRALADVAGVLESIANHHPVARSTP